jgi:putative ABC transport system permease protein
MTEVRARYPELQVLSTTEFARQSGIYWMTQTGAGGAIGLAGILGMLVGALIISQMLYAATVERLDEFATLYAVGAHASLPRQIVAVQSVSSAAAGSLLGAVVLWPLVMAAKRFVVAWITIPWWLPMGCLGVTLAVAIAASRASLRLIRGVDPVHVFRT